MKSYQENRYMFTYFLDLEEQDCLKQYIPALSFSQSYEKGEADSQIRLWGGYELAERRLAIFGNQEQFGYEIAPPIVLLKIRPSTPKFSESLTHRDFLGAILNLGIERKILGDILVEDNIAYVYIHESMAEYVKRELLKVKHTYVTLSVQTDKIEIEPSFLEINGFVPSFRLDVLISLAFHISRKESAEYIKLKRVYKNSRLCHTSSTLVRAGERISVRGRGKFILAEAGKLSKKGRHYVVLKKYN